MNKENRVYVVLDKDMMFTVGVYHTMESVVRDLLNTMHDGNYSHFEIHEGNDDDAFEVIFPHDNPTCVGHYLVMRSVVED